MAKDKPATTEKKIEDLYGLIDGIEVAMMTTRRADGQLVSRAMATQERADGADLWFVTDVATHKLEELETDPHVNLSYYKDRTREWVSVSGTARVVQDRSKIEELYKPDWRMWFGDEGGKRDGGPQDPRMALIAVDADTVVFTKKDAPAPVVLFEMAKGMVTGDPPRDAYDVERVSGDELRRGS
jgi:general stress protein 26